MTEVDPLIRRQVRKFLPTLGEILDANSYSIQRVKGDVITGISKPLTTNMGKRIASRIANRKKIFKR